MFFERLTDSARKVIALARKEASRDNYDFITPEQLLIGLYNESCSGLASHVLRDYKLDPEKVRDFLHRRIPIGPSRITMGTLPYTPNLIEILKKADGLSTQWQHKYTGTEHFLYAILESTQEDPIVADLFKDLNLDQTEMKKSLLELLEPDLPANIRSFYTIPKSEISLEEALEKNGYKIVLPSEKPIFMGQKRIGLIKDSGAIIVTYNLIDHEQIRACLDLRDYAEKNDVTYSEEPPRQEVVDSLSLSRFKKDNTLIERIIGKSQEQSFT